MYKIVIFNNRIINKMSNDSTIMVYCMNLEKHNYSKLISEMTDFLKGSGLTKQ